MRRRDVSVAIVGSGFSGIGLAIRLKQAGFTDLTIFEKAEDLGGVWRDNTYPGAACDAPSHLYSYSFEPKHDWSRRFAEQPEILAYLRHCAAKYKINPHIRFGTEIVEARYSLGQWSVRTGDGDQHRFHMLVAACGQLSNPARPPISGLDTFPGPAFHSAEWDHDLDFTGRHVAVIGNGASAIQFVPIIAPKTASLTVFQLEAHWISRKPDRVYPAWRKRLNQRIPILQKLSRLGVFVWFEALLNPALIRSRRWRPILSPHLRALCHAALRQVKDRSLRERLTPDYEVGCKRILTSSDYYTALQLPHVHLETSPVAEVTIDALLTSDGRSHRADTIILATGFRSQDFFAPMRVVGQHGLDLETVWKDGARAYLGMTVPNFPNFFLMYGPNTNVGSGSIVHMLESQITYITQAAELLTTIPAALDLREDTLETFDAEVQHRLADTVWNTGGCDSWYLDTEHRNTNNWPGSMTEYRRRTRHFDPDDYTIIPIS
ncbi:flavin-containing monooxygenase [Actinomadura sp. 6N118]|uniref:flavin-containing monooxygenase n=1 Tax=Actinomadura sp. 6N118 TaxID=3375151 RepID=UPI0037A54B79